MDISDKLTLKSIADRDPYRLLDCPLDEEGDQHPCCLDEDRVYSKALGTPHTHDL